MDLLVCWVRLHGVYYINAPTLDPARGECLSDEDIALHLSGKMEIKKRVELFAHTSVCQRCADLIRTYPYEPAAHKRCLFQIVGMMAISGYRRSDTSQINMLSSAHPQ